MHIKTSSNITIKGKILKTTNFLSHLYGKFKVAFPLESKHFGGRARGDFCASETSSRVASTALTEWFTFPLSLKEGMHFLTEFIGVTLVYKTIQVTSVQLNKTSSAHWVMYHCPKQSLFPSRISPPLPFPPRLHSLFPLAITTLLLCVCVICFLANPFNFFHPVSPPPSPLPAVSMFHVSMPLVSILFFRLFCSLDSTYKWDNNSICLSLTGLFHLA